MDGILIINKSKGYTSHDIVSKVKKVCKEKVGHAGTLDPNATGVLPLLIGQGTKLSYYLTNHDKEYIATLQLGIKTDTLDCEGQVVEEMQLDDSFVEKKLGEENITDVLKSFIGKQEQVPPIYSAIKVKGKKLYEYARSNEEVEIQPREIEIYNMELIEVKKKEKQIVFCVNCSKGTYIRSLCEDIAKRLGTIGYMLDLERTIVGNFGIEEAITLEELLKHGNEISFLKEHIISIEDFFKDKYTEFTKEQIKGDQQIVLDDKKLTLFLNGVKLRMNVKNGLYRIYHKKNTFIGIGLVENNLLKREIIVENH